MVNIISYNIDISIEVNSSHALHPISLTGPFGSTNTEGVC